MARKGMMGGNIKAVLILAVAAYTGYKGISYISNNMFQTVSPAEAAVQHALKSPVTIFSKTYCGFRYVIIGFGSVFSFAKQSDQGWLNPVLFLVQCLQQKGKNDSQ